MDRIGFDGRVAIVTGGGGALGRAYCLGLAARGAAVVVNDLGGSTTGDGGSSDYADDVVQAIRAAGGRAVANYDTVASEAGGEAMVQAAIDAFGRIDIVINNAGNQRNGRFGELSEQDIDAVFGVHVKGAFFVTQPAYRLMARQGYGRIVLTSSQSGVFGAPFRGNYGAAKTAMIGLMNVVAQEAPAGVVINCIFPNAIGGRMGGTPLAERPDAAYLAAAGLRVRHYMDGMTPAFVAPLALYLASERCGSSQNMYSILGGRYARIFCGLTDGWFRAGTEAPSVEELVGRLEQIDARAQYSVPLSGLDEMDGVAALAQSLQPAG